MANGDITLTVSLSGTLSGGDAIRTFEESKVFSSIADIVDRIANIPTSEVTVLAVGTVGGQTVSTLNGFIVFNMDGSNYVTLGMKDTGAKSAYVKIEAGDMFVYCSDQLETDDDSGAVFSAFNSIDTVTLQANTAAVRCQILAW